MDSGILYGVSNEEDTGMLRNRHYSHHGAQSIRFAQLIVIVLVKNGDQQADQLHYSFASI